MHTQRRYLAIISIHSIVAILVMFTALSAAQAPRAAQPSANPPQMSEKDVAALQDQLLQMLRVSPTLA
jgi:hypothetical protein